MWRYSLIQSTFCVLSRCHLCKRILKWFGVFTSFLFLVVHFFFRVFFCPINGVWLVTATDGRTLLTPRCSDRTGEMTKHRNNEQQAGHTSCTEGKADWRHTAVRSALTQMWGEAGGNGWMRVCVSLTETYSTRGSNPLFFSICIHNELKKLQF